MLQAVAAKMLAAPVVEVVARVNLQEERSTLSRLARKVEILSEMVE